MCIASEIGALNRRGMKALENGDTANAEFLLTQALRHASARGLEGFLIKIHNNLGLVLMTNGSARSARSHFEKALTLLEKRHGSGTRLHNVITRHIGMAQAAAA